MRTIFGSTLLSFNYRTGKYFENIFRLSNLQFIISTNRYFQLAILTLIKSSFREKIL